MVHGDKRQFLSALITLNEETAGAWAREQGIRLLEVSPTDESLESVFAYLVSS